MESLEINARTVEEAILNALKRLGKNREEVDIAVLSEGSRGILGLGGEDARILVTPKDIPVASDDEGADNELLATACEVLETLLRMMRVEAKVEQKPSYHQSAIGEGFAGVVDITGEDLGILIGRHGDTLGALQYITNLVVSRVLDKHVRVLVDVEGYRLRRENSLRGLASRMAERVSETGRPITLEAMPASERRIIHIALSEHANVTTSSIGEGDQRRVVVSPRHP